MMVGSSVTLCKVVTCQNDTNGPRIDCDCDENWLGNLATARTKTGHKDTETGLVRFLCETAKLASLVVKSVGPGRETPS